MFKFLHAADLHLDSPMKGLERYDGAPIELVRGATRRALENLVLLALEERVRFVVIAGDLYDQDWKDYNTALFLAAQMSRLRQAGIRVCLVTGNHDAASQITRSLRMPDNVRILASDRPETVVLEDIGVAIHGQSFASPPSARTCVLPIPRPGEISSISDCSTRRRPGAKGTSRMRRAASRNSSPAITTTGRSDTSTSARS